MIIMAAKLGVFVDDSNITHQTVQTSYIQFKILMPLNQRRPSQAQLKYNLTSFFLVLNLSLQSATVYSKETKKSQSGGWG